MTATVKLLRFGAFLGLIMATATAFISYYEPDRLVNFHEPVVAVYLMGVVFGIALCKR